MRSIHGKILQDEAAAVVGLRSSSRSPVGDDAGSRLSWCCNNVGSSVMSTSWILSAGSEGSQGKQRAVNKNLEKAVMTTVNQEKLNTRNMEVQQIVRYNLQLEGRGHHNHSDVTPEDHRGHLALYLFKFRDFTTFVKSLKPQPVTETTPLQMTIILSSLI